MGLESAYYQTSVELGQQFQNNNKSWDGRDTFKYRRQIRDLVKKYNCKTLLDYGCGKGYQWSEEFVFLPDKHLQKYKDWLGVNQVSLYDPCVEKFSNEPELKNYDIVTCTQVVGSIPDLDIPWVKDRLMAFTGKVCFIGLIDPVILPKGKKQLYDPEYFSVKRSIEWYKQQFSDWTGSELVWWFKGKQNYPEDWSI
jgi:hypothetical protein